MEIGNYCWLRVGLAFNYISPVLLTSVIAPCNQYLCSPTTVGGAKNAHPCEGRSPVMMNDWRRKGSFLLHCETGSQDLSLDRLSTQVQVAATPYYIFVGIGINGHFKKRKWQISLKNVTVVFLCLKSLFHILFGLSVHVLATNTRPRPTARDCQNQNKENILFTNLSCITAGKGSHGRALI